MAAQNQTDLFDAYFRKADLDGDGQISGAEAVAFFQGTNLPKEVLAQVWMHADQKKLGYLGRQEFYNALRLVTVAQSKRDLTPDIVKAALYSPASARIPAPQINVAATPTPHPRVPTQSTGNPSVGVNQQYAQSLQNQVVRPPQAMPPSTSSQMQPPLAAQGMLSGSNMVAPPRLPTSNSSANWQTVNSGGFTTGVSNQVHNRSVSPSTSQGFGLTASGLTPSVQTRPQATPVQISSTAPKPKDTSIPSSQLPAEVSKALVVSGNGFASDSLFGDVFSTTSSQSKQTSLPPTSSASSSSLSTTSVPTSGPHPSAKPNPAVALHGTLPQQPVGGQYPPGHPTGRQYQKIAGQSNAASGSTGFPAGPGNLASGQSAQSQPPWPKMTQSDIQKYTKVFVQVDTDRDGKITGDQARNLFLSWRLPREVLKQVWDLSDQDNDSMLSLREFCTALYLMERYREGRPLPSVLPSAIISDETPSTTSHPQVPYRNVTWGATHGLQQPQASTAPRPPLPSARGRPPRPGSVPQTDAETLSTQQKSKVPILEKNLVDQLSQEEQDSLNSKFKEATEANKKVEELEKEIHDSKAKTEFFRAKMQELILYKSRCDNRLNEIIERTSADKREVEALAKKYEEKYRLSGDVASRLTIEESTFRDIQEKKMELYQAIVKIEQGENKDGALQDRANHIQSSLEELVKSVNERCKQYGLRAKPTSLAELPFGWQLGIQEGAADWDEDWDKFEDEGFSFVKELTLDVQNVIAPPKPKSSLVQKETASADAKSDIPSKDLTTDQSEDGLKKSSSGNPAVVTDKQSQELQDSHVTSGAGGSPHGKKADDSVSSAVGKDSRSDQGGAEPLFSEDKSFDEPSWGKLDSQFPDPVWGFDKERGKETDSDSIFGLGGFNIKPIKTQSSHSENSFPGLGPIAFDSVPSTPAYTGDTFNGKSLSIFPESVPSTPAYTDNMFKGKDSSVFADSVPSTPAYADNMFKGQSLNVFADSVPSTPAYADNMLKGQSLNVFADSVPSTPAYDNMFKSQSSSIFGDSVPSTPAYADNMFKGKSSSAFADSVPSTPAYSDNMFKGKSSSFFADSVPSTPAYHYGSSQQSFGEGSESYSFDSFSRSDSFNMQDGGLFQSRTFDRFDSMRSSTDFDQGYGFPPSSFDSFNAHDQPDKSLSRFDSMQSTAGFDHSHDFQSFDDNDPFGSTGQFRTSVESQTPRKDTDKWSAF